MDSILMKTVHFVLPSKSFSLARFLFISYNKLTK